MKIKVTGNTYQAKTILRDAGFSYDPTHKEWYGAEDNLAELRRISTPTYSRANAKAFAALKIEEAN